jgi:hypothetical protein
MDPIAETLPAGPSALLLMTLGGCLMGAMLGAEPIKARADALAPSPVADTAAAWFDAMHAIGFDRPYQALHGAMRDARTAKFGGK